MQSDSYFAMGKSHTVCQDYAETSFDVGETLAAVSDGCSSSPYTDFGSRFLVRSFMTNCHNGPVRTSDIEYWLREAGSATGPCGLPIECLDATLLVAKVTAAGNLTVDAYGDGVVAVEFKSGARLMWSIVFSGGAPGYPNYLRDQDRLKLYLSEHGTRVIDITSYNKAGESTVRHIEKKLTEDSFGTTLCDFEMSLVRKVFLFSDGVQSFRRPSGTGYESVPLEEVLAEITAIKSPAGEFMVRRMRKFLHDFCPKHGWIHDDDVAVAAIINDSDTP